MTAEPGENEATPTNDLQEHDLSDDDKDSGIPNNSVYGTVLSPLSQRHPSTKR